MKRLAFLMISLVFSSIALLAQVREISGMVTSREDGHPLPGVAVLIKGTTNAPSYTDLDGKYTITVWENATLVFYITGGERVEESVEGRTTIDVSIHDIFGLYNLTVTGYTTRTSESLTSSTSTVEREDLEKGSALNVVQRMQGLVTGVTVTNAHTPDGVATVRVRGVGTVNNNDPLYVIDGVPTTGGMTQINPYDIESMTVLKDASSSAVYGARGANGVIIITTKRGGGMKPGVNFSARVGVTRPTKKYDMLNTKEFSRLQWLEDDWENVHYPWPNHFKIPDYILPARAREGSPEVDPSLYNIDPSIAPIYLIMRANKEGTDWFEEIYQTTPLQEYNLSVTGGSQYTSYAISAGYMEEEGILLYTGFKRYSVRSNMDVKPAKWLKVGQSLGVGFTNGYGERSDNSENSMISQAYRMQPIVPVHDIMGNWGGTRAPATGNGLNPVAELTRAKNNYDKNLRVLGNFYGQAIIMPGLDFRSLFGFDFGYCEGIIRDLADPESSVPKMIDHLALNHHYTIQWNWQNVFSCKQTIGKIHNLAFLAGTEAVSNTYRDVNAGRSTFFSRDVDYMYLNAGEADQTNSGGGTDIRWMSLFGRVNYDLAGKCLVELTFRRDGYSRFGANSRWGNFPAFSAGWRISEEKFMRATRRWLDYLKIRAGWGQAGNDQMGAYSGYTTFSSDINYSYYSITGNNTSTIAGFYSNALGNPDAKWETTTTTNVGLEAILLNNKVSVVFDVWNRNTRDILLMVRKPDIFGQAASPLVNTGAMKNTGLDLQIIYTGTSPGGNFRYNIAANISHYKNEIVKLTDKETDFIQGSDYRQQRYTRAMIGTSFPEFYGYVCDGIFETQAEADAAPPYPGTTGDYNEPGHLIFRDVDGNGYIDDLDRNFIGSPHPFFTGGLTIDLGYKGFDLSAFFYTSYGNDIVNYVKCWIDYTLLQGNRSHNRLYKSWGSPYLEGEATLAKADRDVRSEQFSSHFVEDGSFLRLKTLQLSYTVPQSVYNRLGMNNLQVYVQATNLFTLTKYSGLDPEVRNTSAMNMGVDAGAWPTSTQYMVGVRFGI